MKREQREGEKRNAEGERWLDEEKIKIGGKKEKKIGEKNETTFDKISRITNFFLRRNVFLNLVTNFWVTSRVVDILNIKQSRYRR